MSLSFPVPPSSYVWARFIRAEQRLLEAVEADLGPLDSPLVWYDVALELSRAPDGRLRPRDLQARVLLAKYNLSRLIDRMAGDGLVARAPVAEDARGAYIAITESGTAAAKAHVACVWAQHCPAFCRAPGRGGFNRTRSHPGKVAGRAAVSYRLGR